MSAAHDHEYAEEMSASRRYAEALSRADREFVAAVIDVGGYPLAVDSDDGVIWFGLDGAPWRGWTLAPEARRTGPARVWSMQVGSPVVRGTRGDDAEAGLLVQRGSPALACLRFLTDGRARTAAIAEHCAASSVSNAGHHLAELRARGLADFVLESHARGQRALWSITDDGRGELARHDVLAADGRG